MYVSMIGMMKVAREKGFTIPAASAANEHAARAAIQAAEENNSPLILICMHRNAVDIEFFGSMIRELALRTHIPVALCQDHGATYEEAIWCIKSGFTDIMVDRSTLPYEENVAQVKELVKIAHAVGVGVEAELGHVGGNGEEATGNEGVFTVPSEAVSFVKETGVDALAVAIGTAHGPYKGIPKIDFDLLKKLKEAVDVPLVLHGGSGTGEENLARAAREGICKLNIANDLYQASIANIDHTGFGAYAMYNKINEGYKKKLTEYMKIIGSVGKADLFKK